MKPFLLLLVAMLLTKPAVAEVPRVVTDIAPVHSLVAQVMGDLGAPVMIVPPGTSPHATALRPSQARALQTADVVVWIGPELTPWLSRPTDALAPGAARLVLLGAPQTITRTFRDTMSGGTTTAIDPHAWLDPENARVWLDAIAAQLARTDPENAQTYRANATRAQADIDRLIQQVSSILAPANALVFITLHDAFQYFETRFGLVSSGTVTLGDATGPGPARLAQLRAVLAAKPVTCAFSEPQFNDRLLTSVAAGGDLDIVTLDPMGRGLAPGPALYATLLLNIAENIAECAGR